MRLADNNLLAGLRLEENFVDLSNRAAHRVSIGLGAVVIRFHHRQRVRIPGLQRDRTAGCRQRDQDDGLDVCAIGLECGVLFVDGGVLNEGLGVGARVR